MFYGDEVQDTRQLFFTSWQKYCSHQTLLPLEQQIVDVICDHPEYHSLLNHPERALQQTYFAELGQSNPFLHMGLHLAIREQIATNRPNGIRSVYQQLLLRYVDNLEVEHLMMEKLAEHLWQAQKEQQMPDEKYYLQALTQLLN